MGGGILCQRSSTKFVAFPIAKGFHGIFFRNGKMVRLVSHSNANFQTIPHGSHPGEAKTSDRCKMIAREQLYSDLRTPEDRNVTFRDLKHLPWWSVQQEPLPNGHFLIISQLLVFGLLEITLDPILHTHTTSAHYKNSTETSQPQQPYKRNSRTQLGGMLKSTQIACISATSEQLAPNPGAEAGMGPSMSRATSTSRTGMAAAETSRQGSRENDSQPAR